MKLNVNEHYCHNDSKNTIEPLDLFVCVSKINNDSYYDLCIDIKLNSHQSISLKEFFSFDNWYRKKKKNLTYLIEINHKNTSDKLKSDFTVF